MVISKLICLSFQCWLIVLMAFVHQSLQPLIGSPPHLGPGKTGTLVTPKVSVLCGKELDQVPRQLHGCGLEPEAPERGAQGARRPTHVLCFQRGGPCLVKNPRQEPARGWGAVQRSGEASGRRLGSRSQCPLPTAGPPSLQGCGSFLWAGLEGTDTVSHPFLPRLPSGLPAAPLAGVIWGLLRVGVKLPFGFWGRRTSFLPEVSEVTSAVQGHATRWSFSRTRAELQVF